MSQQRSFGPSDSPTSGFAGLQAFSPSPLTSAQFGGGLQPTLSVASFAGSTIRGGSSSPPPPAKGHGSPNRARRFSSRHVPSAAEQLAQSQAVTPEMVTRFNGLMKHLKKNSDQQEHQKQAIASSMEVMIPEEYDETLRSEFERRCSFGDRLNTEFMPSTKWVKLLKEIGAIVAPDCERKTDLASIDAIPRAEADIIFRKVLHDCEYGGTRLNYELFCKALYLVAVAVRPDLDGDSALNEMLVRVAQAAPEESRFPEEIQDHMLDPNVLLVLDHFKPALHDLFRSFCSRRLSNPASASVGAGTVRLRERSFWKHSGAGGTQQDSLGAGFSCQQMASSPSRRLQKLDELELDEPSPLRSTEADAGGGYGHVERCSDAYFDASPTTGGDRTGGYPTLLAAGNGSPGARATSPLSPCQEANACNRVLAYADSRGWTNQSHQTFRSSRTTVNTTTCGSIASQDPYLYSNGAPTIKNRRSNMALDQLHDMCKELKIFPDLLSRVEIANVFKRAQCAGAVSSHGSSIHGYISKEAFVDAAGQLAIAAFSKEPYCDEYPAPHEKVHAFFVKILPSCSREVHDRFFYGRGAAGR